MGAALALFAVTGSLLLRRPGHPVTIVLAVWVASSVVAMTPADRTYANALWVLGPPLLAVLLVVFPDGPRGRLWRWVLRYQVAALVVGVAVAVAFPSGGESPIVLVSSAALLMFIPIAVASVVSLIRLYRRSSGPRRARIGVVLAAGALLLSPYVLLPLLTAPFGASPRGQAVVDELFSVFFAVVPLAIGAAVLMEPRGRGSRAVDLLLPWILVVAGGLIVGGTAADVAAVAISEVPGDVAPYPAAVVAAASVAVALSVAASLALLSRGAGMVPSEDQRAESGLRDLSVRLAQAPVPQEVPAVVAAAVGEALELRGVAVVMLVEGEEHRVAEWGESGGPEILRPLDHAGQAVGQLVLYPHRDGVAPDLSALDEILPPVASAIAATREAESLRRAHERLVQIRDEERKRLSDDLHDELSPALSGLRLAASAASASLVAGDLDTAASLLARMEFESGRASGVIRGILADLRPDELEETDLAHAVRNRAMTFDRPGRFAVHVEADDPLPMMAAGVELAAYRAASEAVANAARHSGGTQCWVRLSGQSGGLLLEVTDDGIGVDTDHPGGGMGLRSMAGRVDAAGGALSVGRGSGGGTLVRAVFPSVASTIPALGGPGSLFAGESAGVAT